jgi:hypothetical protein
MVYFIYLFFISILAINFEKIKNIKYLDIFVFFILFLIIGFRYRTGGDFYPYINLFDQIQLLDFNTIKSPFYIINYISKFLYLDLFGVNLILSFIFVFCLFFFLKKFNNFYLATVISFPVLIMIYGMGFLRQGIAIVLFLNIISFKSFFYKSSSIICGAFFHLTSIIYLYIYLVSLTVQKRNIKVFFILIILSITIISIFNEQFINYVKYYIISEEYSSSGFIYRNLLTYICAYVYLYIYLFRKKIFITKEFKFIFFVISLVSIIIFPIGLFYSTVIDRLMGYFLPLQILVTNLLYEKINSKNKLKVNYLICILSVIQFIVWYIFGENSLAWEYELFFFPFKFE